MPTSSAATYDIHPAYFPPRSKQQWGSEIRKETLAPSGAAAASAAAIIVQENPFDILE